MVSDLHKHHECCEITKTANLHKHHECCEITPTATTGATHTGKRARVQQDRLPKFRVSGELSAPSSTSNSGEKVWELSVSKRTKHEKGVRIVSIKRN
jgi:hypothetical protein